jgi:hypothetical protein
MPNMTVQRGQQQSAPWAAMGPLRSPFFGLLPPSLLKRLKDFFIYGTDFLPLGIGATATQTIGIQGDADFVVVDINLTCTDPATELVFSQPAPLLLSLQDQGSGRAFQNIPIHAGNVAGIGTLPGYLTYAKLVRANSVIAVTVQNLDGANTYNVRVALSGFKVFPNMAAEG